jgi:hypothetical protein
MKKSTFYLLMLIMSISFFPSTMTAAASNPSKTPATPPSEVPAHVQVQLDRLNEIKAMDKSDMTSSEKKSTSKRSESYKVILTR